MNFLKPDSPLMRLIAKIADLIVLNLLTVICSIPLITIGAAQAANYSVAIKVVKDEDNGVIVPYFKAFKRNFVQATIVWLALAAAIFLIIIDWRWIIMSGWGSTPFIYKLGVIVMSAFVLLITMSIFPLISRYEMRTMEYFKAALMVAVIKFIPLVLLAAFAIGSVIACIWYARWFPALYVFCTTTFTYFMCLVFIKEFNRLEKNREQMEEEAKAAAAEAEAQKEEIPEAAIDPVTGEVSYARAVMDSRKETENPFAGIKEEEITGNKLTKFFKREKLKLGKLNGKQKATYFAQYYLPPILLVLVFGAGVAWFAHDIYQNHKILLTGGLINCEVSKEGREYMTDGYVKFMGYDTSKRTARLADTELSFESDIEYEEKYLDVALRAQMATGTYTYLIIRDDAVDNYGYEDYYQDLGMLTDISKFSKDSFFYNDEDVPVGLKLNENTVAKLGLPDDSDYYIFFAYTTNSVENESKMIDYLFQE